MLKKKIQVREKCWFCEIQKFRKVLNLCNSKIKKCFWKVCTDKGIRIVEFLEKNAHKSEKSVDFVKSKNLEKCWICVILK